jgi:hypothetical protein
MKRIFIALSLAVLAIVTALGIRQSIADEPKQNGKYLIILQAGRGTHEGMARAVHALLYAMEFKANGDEVVLLFDGAGTEWIAEWIDPESKDKLAPMYREFAKTGATEVICDFCSGAFEVKKTLTERSVKLTGEFQGHPSIVKWTNKGYKIIVL